MGILVANPRTGRLQWGVDGAVLCGEPYGGHKRKVYDLDGDLDNEVLFQAPRVCNRLLDHQGDHCDHQISGVPVACRCPREAA